MGKLEYTPGPWKVEVRSTHGEFVRETHIISKDGSHIAEVSPVAIKANAKLIASAPDLFKILCEIENAAINLADAAPSDFKNQRDDLFADIHNAHLHAMKIINKLENE